MLWDCKVAADTWKESGLKLPSWKNSHHDFLDVYWRLREEAKGLDWNLFATIAWGLWNNRNLFKHEGKCKSARALVGEASRYTDEYKQGMVNTSLTTRQPPSFGSQWRPPECG